MDLDRRLEVIEQENELLREQVRRLERALIDTKPLPFEWGLTGQEARLFGVMVNRRLATSDSIMAALYRDFGLDEPEEKIVDVLVCKIRKKLKPFGVTIQTIWGQGYALEDGVRSQLRSAA